MSEDIQYLEKCRELSLNARICIALLCFERFCTENSLSHGYVDEFINYMWSSPVISGDGEFEQWEENKPDLVRFGLGDDCSDSFESELVGTGLSVAIFRRLVESTVDILWYSFWGAAENEKSLGSLKVVLGLTNHRPPLTPFLFSRFTESGGWGDPISPIDLKYWRHCDRARY